MSEAVVIAAARRTPVGAFLGALSGASAPELGAAAVRAALADSRVPAGQVDEVILGCVLPAGLGQAPARQAAIGAGVPASVPATTVNKVCGSGMKALMLGADAILAGGARIVLAGGLESMSNAPYLLAKARQGYRMGHGQLLDHMLYDGLQNPYDGALMGHFADATARQYGFTRAQQDAYAAESVRRALAACERGAFKDEIAPVSIKTRRGEQRIEQDEPPFKCDIAKIPSLRPAFDTDGDVDLYEINEAFAVVAMAAMRDLGLDHARVNVHGSACALGHPIGASGARITTTLLHALRQRGGRRGVASLCIGGGEATAIAIEVL